MLGIFKQNYFRGQEVVVHDPGYRDGSASVLIRDPFYKDKDLFVTPNITGGVLSSMPPVPHPFPPSGPPPGFATHPMPTYATAPRPFPPVVPTSHNWPVASPPPLPPPAMFYPPPPQHRLQQYTYQDPGMTWNSGIYHPLSTTGTPPSDSRRSSTSQEVCPPSPHDSKWLTTTAQGGNYTSSSGSTPTYTHARPVHAEIPPRTVPRKFGSDTVLVVDGSAGREKVPFVYSA